MFRKVYSFGAITVPVCLLMLASGCGRQSGYRQVSISGSTTVLPISQKTAEAFMDRYPDVRISVGGGGSGVGIAAIIDGTTDIGQSSRAIRDSEINTAAGRGVDVKSYVIAMDGMAVIVNNSNGVNGLTRQQVKDIYTGKISNWSQVGGADAVIVVTSRDSASGTFEAFNELALDKERVRPDALMQASNQAIATTVTQTPAAIGYVGLGYLSDNVKAISVDGTMPSRESVLSGEYKLARSLFMYTDGQPGGAVREYLDFVMGAEGQKLVEELGFVPVM